MPRIDPERLLKCLQPLLDCTSGSIKSSDDVDKILGLMSKFSKKLVSKCIYVNILRSTRETHPRVLELFMERGGWALIFGWTSEGVTSKNYPLLKVVLQLLLETPTTIARLRENKFPILIKGLSKECEDEETKNLAKRVVASWITIAKAEGIEKTDHHQQPQQQQPQLSTVQIPIQAPPPIVPVELPPVEQNHIIGQDIPAEIGSLGMNADSLLNIDPSLIPDADTENQLMDLDFSHSDLPNIDFNIDILGVVDQQHNNVDDDLSAVLPTNISNISSTHHVIEEQVTSNKVDPPSSIITTNPNILGVPQMAAAVPCQSQAPPPVKEEVMGLAQVQQAPKIYIKMVDGQRTVVSTQTIVPASSEQLVLIQKDGKNYLMRRISDQPTTIITTTPVPIKEAPVLDTRPTLQNSVDTTDSGKVKAKVVKSDAASSFSNKQPKLKTYGSPTTKGKPPMMSKDNSVVQNKKPDTLKPGDKHEKEKKPHKEKTSSDSHKRSKSSGTSSSSSKAAAAAKMQAEEEKLREEIRKQKALMKKRAKEAEKQKQQEKDQETLRKLNLSSTSPSAAMKIPKIPKKNTSFVDAIGIPGADAVDKIKKVSPDKTSSNKTTEETPVPVSPKKFYGKKEEPEVNDADKPKERRHKVKVFISSKSRSEDLLKEMTESGKSKSSKEKEKEKEDPKLTAISLGNSIPAVPPKPTKRLSTDSIEKPGDPKKTKLSETTSGKSDKPKESSKDSSKDKKKPGLALKESSLFMDMLNASYETTKPSKRKRRPSTSNEKEKGDATSPPPEKPLKSPTTPKEFEMFPATTNHDGSSTPEEPVKKPFMNFYRDTLNDKSDSTDEEEDNESTVKVEKPIVKEEVETIDLDAEEGGGSFTPQENDGKIKSALCLIRPRNRPRKTVRWKDDDELKEFHFFEMDETERVNVTKQKDFTELSQHEKAIERSYHRRKEEEEEEERNKQWRLYKIIFSKDALPPAINSAEKEIQEERESTVLGLFLPPGANLPDFPIEPDATIPVDRVEPKLIPVEDVNGITKVCDYRTHSWPASKGELGMVSGFGGPQPQMEDMSLGNMNMNMNSFVPPPVDYNPWNANMGFSIPPPAVNTNMPDLSSFQQFPPPLNMNLLAQAPPSAFPNHPNPFAFPPAVNGPPQPGMMEPFPGNRNNRGNNNRGGRMNDGDQRRNFPGRDRGNNRDRDYRDDRGNDRDRDYRRRDRDNNDRHHDRDRDRDRNNRDHRSGGGRNVRKDIPCRFFKKGHCSLGNRCDFSHDIPNHQEDRKNSWQDGTDSASSSNRQSRWSSPDTTTKDMDLRQQQQQLASEDTWETPTIQRSSSIDETDANRFALPPSSPAAEQEMSSPFSSNPESTKVIPV